jgi:ABC-type oligopeptide transport system ATPase subunit
MNNAALDVRYKHWSCNYSTGWCEDDLSLLFVSHDLNVVRMMSNRAKNRALFENSQTDYTRELVDAVLHIGPANGKAIEVFSS